MTVMLPQRGTGSLSQEPGAGDLGATQQGHVPSGRALYAVALSARVPEPRPVWLAGGDWPLLSFVHVPAGVARGAVVLCSPLFGEELAARPLYRAVARALAEQGLLAVRFDYEGTGDSGGPSTGPGRLEAWLDGVDDAVASVRELWRGPIALLGVRSGSLVAAAAAARGTDVDAVALWDPWRSGRSFLRREHALHALQFRTPPDAGHVEVAGLVLDEETSAAVTSLRLPQMLRARRGLLVVRPGTTPAAVALETRRGGSTLRTTADVLEAAPGEQEALFEGDALRRRMPTVTISGVVGWLSEAVAQLAPAPAEPSSRGSAGGAGSGVPARRADRARRPVPASDLLAIRPAVPGEPTVYERTVRIGSHGLFGVETVPSTGMSPDAPVVLLFPSGMDSHIGPHRLWVTLARRWASLGARCIRVDLSGLGESPPRPGRSEHVMRAPEAFDDVAEAVFAVGDPRRVVLVGLCSSAYQALESGIELEPLGVLAVNPLLRFTPPEVEAGGEVSARRRLCEPRREWEKTARRLLPGPVGQALADVRRRSIRWRRVLLRESPAKAQRALAGVNVHIVCREYEADQLATFGLLDRPDEGHRIEVMPDLEHSLALAFQRQEVADRLTRMLRTVAGARLCVARPTQLPTETPDAPGDDRDHGEHEDLASGTLAPGPGA